MSMRQLRSLFWCEKCIGNGCNDACCQHIGWDKCEHYIAGGCTRECAYDYSTCMKLSQPCWTGTHDCCDGLYCDETWFNECERCKIEGDHCNGFNGDNPCCAGLECYYPNGMGYGTLGTCKSKSSSMPNYNTPTLSIVLAVVIFINVVYCLFCYKCCCKQKKRYSKEAEQTPNLPQDVENGDKELQQLVES
eukprot:390088_1